MLGGVAGTIGLAAYTSFPHVAARIDRFLTGEATVPETVRALDAAYRESRT